MRKCISISHWLLSLCAYLMIFGLVSCSDDEAWSGKEDIPEGNGTGALQVKMDITSMAATADLESKINIVRIVGFRSVDGSLKFNYLYPNEENSDPANILQEVTTGYTDLCIIVNETPEMSKTLGSVSTVEEVRTQVLSLNDFNLFADNDSLAKYGLPMYKEYSGLPIKMIHTESSPYLLKAEVERIMAKLTLRITNLTHKEVTLDSIKILSLPEKSWLYPAGYADETTASAAIKLVSVSDGTYNDVNLYLPEYVLTDLSKRSILNLKGTAKIGASTADTIQCSYTISLGHGLSKFNKESLVEQSLSENKLSEEDFNIVRNTHYTIMVSDIKGYENDKLTFLVGVNPWINVKENAYEGGTWRQQPISQRIPIKNGTSFTAKFIHTNAPYIVYNWCRSQYKQTDTDKEPALPTIELLKSETLKNGEKSVLEFTDALPTASGEIYCEAAPIGGQHFRKSNAVTLMVIGDWDGDGLDIFPDIQKWIPKTDMPLGASYLLRDTRDNKIYRTKRMADGNWWMIQDLAYSETSPTPISNFMNIAVMGSVLSGQGSLGSKIFGACCISDEDTGGYLYSRDAAIAIKDGLISTPDETKNQENILGVCPVGWHLPGNRESLWNREWVLLTEKIVPVTVNTISKYGYYDSKDFNAYTTTYVDVKSDNSGVEYKKGGNTYRFHGGYTTVSLYYLSLGVKIGFDSVIIPEQTEELYIFTNPNKIDATNFVFTQPYQAGSIRCIRDYTIK